jgi:hypothetical protein
MRSLKTIVVVLAAAMGASADAANYYVATNGSNSNAGTLAQPFRTIQQAANSAQEGDNVYVMEGTYRETVTVAKSGTDSAPITFQPYRGARVTITGLDPVSGGWTNHSSSIYSSSVAGGASQVFVNGRLMLGARWPNAVYNNPLRAVQATVGAASIQAPPASSTITDSALAGTGNWTGAKMSITSGGEWVASHAVITGRSGNNLSFEWSYPRLAVYDPAAGNPYYLYGVLGALDAAKEWHYDSAAGKLYLNAPGGTNPNSQAVEVRTRQYGFDLGSRSNIHISGFRLQAASIKIGGNFNTVDNCQILHPRAFSDPVGLAANAPLGGGVEITGQNNTVRNSEIAYSWGDGVTLKGSGNTVSNNIIHDVGWLATNSGFVNAYHSGGNNTIANNTMYNGGNNGVVVGGDSPNTQIQNNDIAGFGLLTADLGGVYTSGNAGDGSVIAYNRVHDSGNRWNSGIYLDNYSSGISVHNNLVYNTKNGVVVNKNPLGQPNNHTVYNNTLWNVNTAMSAWGPDGFALAGVNTYNNLSNDDTWVGTDVQRNRTQAADQFVDSDAGNYCLTANSIFSGKRAIDYGVTDSTHPTDPHTGSAPDAGAFESGITPWTAGANWKTWLFANQKAASLTSALSISSGNVRTTAGPLVVGNSDGVDSRTFLKFNLAGLANAPITVAALRIYENAAPNSEGGNVTLCSVASAWTDQDVAYSQPVHAFASGFYDPANLDFYTDIDVTAAVRGWLSNPASNYGFSLRDAAGEIGAAKYFDGLYGITAPQLIITYAVPEPAPYCILASGLVVGLFCHARKTIQSRHRLITLLALAGPACAILTFHTDLADAQPLKGLFYNEDGTNFIFHTDIPEGKAGATIDRYVDVVAEAGVKTFLFNTNDRRTNYRSRVWESYWDGYDSNGPDNQPFLAAMPRNEVAAYRRALDNLLAIQRQGIDLPDRVIRRCRHRGMSPWISLRMNDCHYNDIPSHPFHGSFWKKNPEFSRKNSPGYYASCLDYAHPEVRDFFKALIVESLDRYDIDGLELDFMREPYLFSAGQESQGAKTLSGWMREVRRLVEEAAAKRGHPIRLGVRVPSRPEVALALGLDAVAWAREGLIDLLVVTPRWATLEFDMPVEAWRKELGASKTTLAGGLEVLYQPYPGSPMSLVSPELAMGAAASVLSSGADAVYVFNYYQIGHPGWPPSVFRETLTAMNALDTLQKRPRTVAVTYRDITAPGESYHAPLPAIGSNLRFPMKFGPVPEDRCTCELLIEIASPAAPPPIVAVNDYQCEVDKDVTRGGLRLLTCRVPVRTLNQTPVQRIRIVSGNQDPMTIRRVEMSLKRSLESEQNP